MHSGPPPAAAMPGLHDLPEEDQEEHFELPTLPENKDPLQHTISLQKKQANSKRIVRRGRGRGMHKGDEGGQFNTEHCMTVPGPSLFLV